MLIKHQSFLIIVSSPSGAGKSTLCKMVIKNDDHIKLSISTTTRQRRPKEVDGADYHFVDKLQFQKMMEEEDFLEHALVFDNNYGTKKEIVQNELKNNNDVIFDIDWQGARQIKERFDSDDIISIFILPPSIVELEKRLKTRAQDDQAIVEKRMKKAQDEISHFDEYDYVLINKDLEETYNNIATIIQAKRLQRMLKQDLQKFVLEELS